MKENKRMIKEEKIFNRLIGGVHSSISSHISEYFLFGESEIFQSNIRFYFEKVGNFPERIENLYFSLSFLLRHIL